MSSQSPRLANMPGYINVTSAPLSPPLLTPVLAADASVEDYERAIEIEKKKHQKILEARQKVLEHYNLAQDICEQAQMALEQASSHEQQGQGQGEVKTPVKGREQGQTPNSSNDSTPSKPPHKRVRSSLNAEAPEFVPGFMHSDKSSSG